MFSNDYFEGVVMYDLITLQPPGRRYPLFNYAFRPEIRFKGDAPKGLWELMLACVRICFVLFHLLY